MKKYKTFLFAVLPALAMSFLMGCNNGGNKGEPEPEEEVPLEIGDTVKEWCSTDDYEELPINLTKDATKGTGKGTIVDDLGYVDSCSLKFEVKNGDNSRGYIGSDALEEPYFTEDDAKNGDEVSLMIYIPKNSNLVSLQLQVLPYSKNANDAILGDVIEAKAENEEKWIYAMKTFDTLETLGAIGVIYKVKDASSTATFYIDDINITLGEETVKTGYESNGESLWETYEENFRVGTAMSGNMLHNTEMRKLIRENFNSITAENEAKPERILDKEACQKLAATDQTKVAITTAPFEKIYDFAAKNHIGVRHHTFVWYSQTPEWFFNVNYADNGQRASKSVMLQRMENYIRVTLETVNERWPGLVYAIDVVNEACQNGGAGYNQNNKWYDTIGDEFVTKAFEYASLYRDPEQKLYYNDYAYDYNTSECEKALNVILKDAIAQGTVDGVGIQAHTDSDQNMEAILTDAKMICAKGLDCQITEIDITVNGSDENSLNKQKTAYKNLVKKILKANEDGETNVDAMVVWGTTDDTSWKRGQNPLLFNSNYAKKPAYYGFLEAIDEYN